MNSSQALKSHLLYKRTAIEKVAHSSDYSTKKEKVMYLGIIKAASICIFGTAVIAGCASSPSSPSSPSVASASSNQSGVRSGKITAVETVAVVDQALVGNSSGSSTVVTAASGGPTPLTVQFNDGSEGRYIIDNPSVTHVVGETVYVTTDGERTGIMRR